MVLLSSLLPPIGYFGCTSRKMRVATQAENSPRGLGAPLCRVQLLRWEKRAQKRPLLSQRTNGSTGRRSTETPPYRSSRRYVGARFRRRKSSALLTLASKSGWSRARCCSSSDSLRKRSGHSGHWRTSIVLHPRTACRRHLTARLIGRVRGAASGPVRHSPS